MNDIYALSYQLGKKWFKDFQAEFLVEHGSLIDPKFHSKNYVK
jgi:hypothetical protein